MSNKMSVSLLSPDVSTLDTNKPVQQALRP